MTTTECELDVTQLAVVAGGQAAGQGQRASNARSTEADPVQQRGFNVIQKAYGQNADDVLNSASNEEYQRKAVDVIGQALGN